MEVKKAKKRYPYIDILNIVAILGVLFLHHNFGAINYEPNGRWALDVVTKVLFRYAVPVFIMISGATLLGYREKYDTKTFFKKRFMKLLVPAICWIVLMYAWRIFILKDPAFLNFSPTNILSNILKSRENDNYWFIFLILGIYLTIPILSHIAGKKNKRTLQYAIVAMVIFNSLLPALCTLIGVDYNNDLMLNLGNYIIYILLGYYIHTFPIKKERRHLIYAAAIAALILNYALTLIISHDRGYFFDMCTNNTAPLSIIYSAGLFLLAKNLFTNIRSKKLAAQLSKLASCSFGIYLSHLCLMWNMEWFLRNVMHFSTGSFAYRFLFPFVTYTICACLVLIIKKIPLVRRIVP
ncbi:acyltransferase [Candidatus Saccharibacteria bacterium]|nr:acyltransferase [Candidatus Saccharibacteria bacterium]